MKAIRDLVYLVDCLKPFKLPRYEIGALPDPGPHVDCLIIVNDRQDGQPRARLALSNGASWDMLAGLHDAPAGQVVDVVPMVRQAVRDTLPALLPAPAPVQMLAAPQSVAVTSDASKELAACMLEMAEQINELQRRVHFLEHNALSVETSVLTQGRAA